MVTFKENVTDALRMQNDHNQIKYNNICLVMMHLIIVKFL